MSLPSIAQHAKSHGIVPDKRLGQNFLFDLSLCDKIARTAGNIKDKIVLEVGPGPAGLSRAILARDPKILFAVEKDSRCIALLEEVKEHFRHFTSSSSFSSGISNHESNSHEIQDQVRDDDMLKILNQDAMTLKLHSLGYNKITIIANLPYNIGTELLFRWLDELEYVESMTLMLQKEVVDRICAKPSTKAYGKLSIMCQLVADVEKEFDVSPEAFYPPPKVTSSIVRVVPKKQQHSKEIIECVRKIVSLAFNQRRKMLKSSLKGVILEVKPRGSQATRLTHEIPERTNAHSRMTDDLESILRACSINPEARAENLTIEDYVRLACHLQN